MTVTVEQLAAWRALEQQATPGPWSIENWTDEPNAPPLTLEARVACNDEWSRKLWRGDTRPVRLAEFEEQTPDAAFIAAARTALPALLQLVEELQAVVDAAERWAEDSPGDDCTNSQSSLNLGHAILAYRKTHP